jgi:enediyne biosynthesis protein E4
MTARKECLGTFALVVLTIVSCLSTAEPQAAPQKQEASQSAALPTQTQGAVSSGGAHAAVLDSEKRPITAGGFVESGPRRA